MSNSTVFVDYSAPVIAAAWLNDINNVVYNILDYNGTTIQTPVNVGNLTFSDTGILGSFQGTTNSYEQVVIQNSNTGATASADFIVANNATTATTNYGDFGINGTNFSGTGSLNLPGATYLYSTGGDLVLGTLSSNAMHFVVGNGATDAMTISTGSVVSLGSTPTAGDSTTKVATTAFLAMPGPIGVTTPNSGAFTTLTSSGAATLNSLGVTNNQTVGGTLGVTGAITPSQTAGIVGTTTNNNANAGSFGEFQTANTSSTSMTNGTPANVTSISLTAGDWEVWGTMQTVGAGSAVTSNAGCGVNTTSATFPTLANGYYTFITGLSTAANGVTGIASPRYRISLASTTTVYLVGQVGWTTGTMTANGVINARRMR